MQFDSFTIHQTNKLPITPHIKLKIQLNFPKPMPLGSFDFSLTAIYHKIATGEVKLT